MSEEVKPIPPVQDASQGMPRKGTESPSPQRPIPAPGKQGAPAPAPGGRQT